MKKEKDQLKQEAIADVIREISGKLTEMMKKEANTPLSERKNGWDTLREVKLLLETLKQ